MFAGRSPHASPVVRRVGAVVLPSREWWLNGSVSAVSRLTLRAKRMQDFVEFFGRPDAADDDLAYSQAASLSATAPAGAAFVNGHKVAVLVKPVLGAPRAGRVVP